MRRYNSPGLLLCMLATALAAVAEAGSPRPGLIAPYGYSGVREEDSLLERDSFRPESGAPRSTSLGRKSVQKTATPSPTHATASGTTAPSTPSEKEPRSHRSSGPNPAKPLATDSSDLEEPSESLILPRRQLESRFDAAVAGVPSPPGTNAVTTSLIPVAPPAGELAPPPDADVPPAGGATGHDTGRVLLDDEDRVIYFQPAYREPERHWLPAGLLYKSYLAGEKESRFALQTLNESGRGMIWEVALGGRVGIYRWGPLGIDKPNGWQLDIEGASFVRLDLEQAQDVDAVDFRFGIPITYRHGRWAYKTGYYHISSHTGDEYMVKHPTYERINYVRDSALFGVSYDATPDTRVYGEIAYAIKHSGGAEPLEFQFGGEYSPARAGGAPFAAANIHLREEFNFGGSINLEAGWQWRGADSGHLLRVGAQHFNGKSMQYSFFNRNEALTGLGIWFDY